MTVFSTINSIFYHPVVAHCYILVQLVVQWQSCLFTICPSHDSTLTLWFSTLVLLTSELHGWPATTQQLVKPQNECQSKLRCEISLPR